MSWEISTDPVEVGVDGVTATAQVTINSTKVDKNKLKELEDKLYGRGTGTTSPTLPTIAEVINMFKSTTPGGGAHTAESSDFVVDEPNVVDEPDALALS